MDRLCVKKDIDDERPQLKYSVTNHVQHELEIYFVIRELAMKSTISTKYLICLHVKFINEHIN